MEEKMRHLEMVQGIITRMSTNSFMLKGWTVTLVAGIFILASKDVNLTYFSIAYIPIVMFWFLDSYYLQLERKYRKLYENIGERHVPDLTFTLKIPDFCKECKQVSTACKVCDNKSLKYPQNLWATSEYGFYVPFIGLVSAVLAMYTFISL